MNPLDITVPFGLGVVGSLHCMQMCGPLVVAYGVASRGRIAAHACYNAGRITTYALLGALAGAAGGGIELLAGWRQTAAVTAGVLMIAAGLLLLPRRRLVKIEQASLSRFLSRAAAALLASPEPESKLLLGMLLGFLPCGLLYAALLKAMGTGSAAAGAASMLAFGAGTAFALLGVGVFSSAIAGRLGRWSHTLAALSVVSTGAFLVWRGVAPLAMRHCHGG